MQVADIQNDPEYSYVAHDVDPIRTTLAVPMLKGDELIGTITIYRLEVKPFTAKQIALMETFADQAVIAIENVRLFEEVQQRTEDLTEALEQQTATSEVLQVISRSPGELVPVFESILANATRICEAKFANLWLHDGRDFQAAAIHGAPAAYRQLLQNEIRVRPGAGMPLAEVIKTKQPVQMADMSTSDAYLKGDPVGVASVEIAGTRTLVCVPMLKENELIGAIAIYRQEVQPFTDKQIELVQNFAAQAVIAIENTRLLNELRELLDRQTATSEVLEVISSSPGELEPVFEAVLANATRICGANFGTLNRRRRRVSERRDAQCAVAIRRCTATRAHTTSS